MEEFRQHLNQLYRTSEPFEYDVNIKPLLTEIELIGRTRRSDGKISKDLIDLQVDN